MKSFQIDGFLKHREEDIFNDGCEPATVISDYVDYLIQAGTVADAISQAAKFIGVTDKENILINSCDDPGRIDFQVYEDAEGLPASDFDFEQWRKGFKKLWLCTYSAELKEVESGLLLHQAIVDDVEL